MNWRVVYNDQTQRYRIESKRWWGWEFIVDADSDNYLSFSSCIEARNWVCQRMTAYERPARRWRVLTICDCPKSSV